MSVTGSPPVIKTRAAMELPRRFMVFMRYSAVSVLLFWTGMIRIRDNKKGQVGPALFYFICPVLLLLKEFAERVDEDEDQDDNESINRERLDHRETDDECRHNLRHDAWIPCDTLAGSAYTVTHANTATESSKAYSNRATESGQCVIEHIGCALCCGCFLSKRYWRQHGDEGECNEEGEDAEAVA